MPEVAKRVYRNIVVLYTACIAFIAGLISVILLDKGLSISQLGLYAAIYSISVVILEVPTGAFADVYGRKNSILLAFLIEIIFLSGFLFLEAGLVFAGFAIVAAAADSFISGSAEAHAVDILKTRRKMRYLHQLLASGKVYMFGTLLIGSVIGGYIAKFSYSYPIILCLVFAVFGLVYSFLSLKETRHGKNFAKTEHSIFMKMRETISKLSKNKPVKIIYLVSFLFGIGTVGLFTFWQPAFVELNNWDASNLGFFFTLISICTIFGAKISGYFKANTANYSIALFFLFLLLALSGIFHIPLWAPLLVLGWQIALGFIQPIENTILNENTSSSVRATTISLKNLSYRLSFGLGGLVFWMVGEFSIPDAWIVTSFAFLAGAILVLMMRKK